MECTCGGMNTFHPSLISFNLTKKGLSVWSGSLSTSLEQESASCIQVIRDLSELYMVMFVFSTFLSCFLLTMKINM